MSRLHHCGRFAFPFLFALSFYSAAPCAQAENAGRHIWAEEPVIYPEDARPVQRYRTWDQEIYPIGNGRIGAALHGDPVREHIQFNEDSLWVGNEHNTGGYQPFGDIYVQLDHEEYSDYRRELDIERAVHRVS
jgi:alpha-L-fucosidase 2